MLRSTNHATIRSQQRGMPPIIQEWLIGYGEELYDHHGAIVYYFNQGSRRKLEKTFGREPIRRFHEWLNAYAVVSVTDGLVITIGKRYKKINH